ncbi:hypothetical protein DFH11DRAFT_1608587 [Phellopilus nigrolimitatus]|nr:hypothetical protein DFH11DRAFT_1608587 [Phellopilus nigrolimitatus]
MGRYQNSCTGKPISPKRRASTRGCERASIETAESDPSEPTSRSPLTTHAIRAISRLHFWAASLKKEDQHAARSLRKESRPATQKAVHRESAQQVCMLSARLEKCERSGSTRGISASAFQRLAVMSKVREDLDQQRLLDGWPLLALNGAAPIVPKGSGFFVLSNNGTYARAVGLVPHYVFSAQATAARIPLSDKAL